MTSSQAVQSTFDELFNSMPDFAEINGVRPTEIKTYHRSTYGRIAPEKTTFEAKGKTVLITAGATGIGYAISESFCKAGIAHLIIIQRREEVLAEARKSLEAAYPNTKLTTYAASQTDHARVKEIIQSAGRIDVLVPCATAAGMGPAKDMTLEQMTEVFETNVVAPHRMISEFLALPSDGPRSVISISSASSQICIPMQVMYGPSKAAINQILQHFAQEHASENVKFYSVHPGLIYSPMVSTIMPKLPSANWEDPELPGDFVVWLASPEAEFLNGRFVWAQWDVDELVGMKEKILKNPNLLTTSLVV